MPETLNKELVLEILKRVKYPGLSRDIVSFGFVQDLEVGGGNVSFHLSLTSNTPGVAEQIKHDCESLLAAQPGVRAVTIRTEVKPPTPVAAAVAKGAEVMKDTRFIVAVASGKGGVGKSTVATNLALSLANIGFKVGLMDSDIFGPSQQMMMGIKEKPYLSEDEKIIPIERYGVNVMSIGFLMDVDTPVIWRGPMVYKAVEQLLADVAWGKQDFLIVDLPPGTGDAQLTLTQKVQLSGAIIVTTPQDVALIDARKGLAMFRQVNVPVLGIIENMSFYECPKCHNRDYIFKKGGGQKTSEILGVPFLGGIPIDPKVVLTGDEGNPIVVSEPGSTVSQAFASLARRIAENLGA